MCFSLLVCSHCKDTHACETLPQLYNEPRPTSSPRATRLSCQRRCKSATPPGSQDLSATPGSSARHAHLDALCCVCCGTEDLAAVADHRCARDRSSWSECVSRQRQSSALSHTVSSRCAPSLSDFGAPLEQPMIRQLEVMAQLPFHTPRATEFGEWAPMGPPLGAPAIIMVLRSIRDHAILYTSYFR